MSGWNGSDGTKPQKVEEKKSPSIGKGIVAGVIVVALAAIACYFILIPDGKSPVVESEESKTSEVAQVKNDTIPDVTATNKPQKAEVEVVDGIPQKGLWTNDQGVVYFNGLILPHSRRKDRPRPAYAIFDSQSENEIACLLMTEPGTQFFGTPRYGEKFEKDFMKSCERPIVISQDDSDYVKELKRLMIDTKIDLRNRMADGESLGKIISDTREELQRLGVIKRDLQFTIREMVRKDATSEADVDNIIESANKILADKGIAPLKMTPILKRSLVRIALRNTESGN